MLLQKRGVIRVSGKEAAGMETAKRQGCAGQGRATGIRQGASPQERTDGQEVRFSAHAAARIEKRGVKLSPNDLTRLGRAVDRMQEKGVQDALIYINHAVALIVSVANRTVITAVDEASAKENIFTNIDSAAIL